MTPTTDEILEQARADMAQLDIGQLRCGVLLQLMHIERLTKERDTASLAAAGEVMEAAIVSRGEIDRLTKERDEYTKAADMQAMAHKLVRDALMSAVKLAIDEMEYNQYAVANEAPHADVMAFCEAIETLKKVVLK